MIQVRSWIQHFENMGLVRWPMVAAALLLLLQIARVAAQRHRRPARHLTMSRHAILVWGLLNALLGVLGTALGLVVTARSVERAGRVDPDLLGPGISVALSPAVVGCSLFAFAVLAWLVLTHVRSAESKDTGSPQS
ncbi:MAG: MotA/TolQ/ExbB proton channel family protein [Dehalococcoidia bacterium]